MTAPVCWGPGAPFGLSQGTQTCPELCCRCAYVHPYLLPVLIWHPSWIPVLAYCLPPVCLQTLSQPPGFALPAENLWAGAHWGRHGNSWGLPSCWVSPCLCTCCSLTALCRRMTLGLIPLSLFMALCVGSLSRSVFHQWRCLWEQTDISVSTPGKTAHTDQYITPMCPKNHKEPSEVLAMHFLNTLWLLLVFVNLCLGHQLNMQLLDWLQRFLQISTLIFMGISFHLSRESNSRSRQVRLLRCFSKGNCYLHASMKSNMNEFSRLSWFLRKWFY